MKPIAEPLEPRPASSHTEVGLAGIVDLATGFQRAQALFAANELGVFRILTGGPKSAEEVARALETDVRGVQALLDACVGLALLRKSARGYENSRTASLFLAREDSDSFAPVLRFWKRFSYGPWGRLAEAIQQNRPQTSAGMRTTDLFEHLATHSEELSVFLNGLAGLASWPARRLADTLALSHRRHLLDVGGGLGTFGEAIAKRHPHLKVTLFDLEPVCVLAREYMRRSESADRIHIVPGDFRVDPLPGSVDCALVSNVLHDWPAEECRALLAKVYAALDPGGEIVVHDLIPASEITADVALFSLALVVDTSRGRVHPKPDLEQWLTDSGFRRVRHQSIGVTGLVIGERSS